MQPDQDLTIPSLLLPSGDYPFKPPDIKLFTPSGRFKPETKICTSMTSFHPSTWNPAWSVATILTGLLSFMLSEEITTGSMTASSGDRKALAEKSHAFNIGNKKFRDIFPDVCLRSFPSFDLDLSPDARPFSNVIGSMPARRCGQSQTCLRVLPRRRRPRRLPRPQSATLPLRLTHHPQRPAHPSLLPTPRHLLLFLRRWRNHSSILKRACSTSTLRPCRLHPRRQT